MAGNKVTHEVAVEEIEGWLDYKKIYNSTREENKSSIDLLTEAMEVGDLTLNADHEFVHKLLVPEALSNEIQELKYRARLNDNMLKPHLQGVKATDADGRLLAHVAALTNQPKNVLSKLDSSDKKIMMSIAVFFL